MVFTLSLLVAIAGVACILWTVHHAPKTPAAHDTVDLVVAFADTFGRAGVFFGAFLVTVGLWTYLSAWGLLGLAEDGFARGACYTHGGYGGARSWNVDGPNIVHVGPAWTPTVPRDESFYCHDGSKIEAARPDGLAAFIVVRVSRDKAP
jgi:hypothetical protein